MASWKNPTGTPPPRRRSLPPEARRPGDRQPGPTATVAGILRPAQLAAKVDLARLAPSPGVAHWVEHFWSVRWDLAPNENFVSEVVPHPAVQVSFESGDTSHYGYPMPAALVHGPPVHRFTIELTGSGRVFGVKFRPGGFAALTGSDVATWRGRVEPLATAFVDAPPDLLSTILREPADAGRQGIVEDFLQQRVPHRDERYEHVLGIVAAMIADPGLISVEMVARHSGITERTMQRLFRRYVGVTPKWVLRRYRLHDAVTLIDAGEGDDLAALAHRLGWYDQAHFTREFTAQVGQSPSSYLAAAKISGDRAGLA